MNETKLLVRSLVRTYYESNVGFFLVVLYLAFGLMRSTEHIAIATSIATSWTLTLITLALWLLYGLKTTGYIYKTLQAKSYRVLRELALYRPQYQWKSLSIVHLTVLAPAWLYGIFIAYFSWQYGAYDRLVVMILFWVLLTITSTWLIIYTMKYPVWEKTLGIWHLWVGKRFALPHSLWYIRYIFVNEPLATFLAKVGSLLMLTGTFYLYGTDTYDWRLPAIGSLFAFAFNSMLVYGLFYFQAKNEWIIALPRKRIQLILSALGTLVFLFIPEMGIILGNAFVRTSPFIAFKLSAFVVALAFFWLGTLIRFPITREDYGKRIFYLSLLMVLVVMYSTPLLLINLLLFAIGGWCLYGSYKLKWAE